MNGNVEQHYQNRERLTEEDLRPFHGKHVAWSMDGTKIVAKGDDFGAVFQAVVVAGLDTEQVVFAYVPAPDELFLGWQGVLMETTE